MNKDTRKGIRIKTERVQTYGTQRKMVQSGIGRQQEESKELARYLKGKIIP
jgi:translation initiation factor 1 (eIF-1/SUI1)